MYFNCEVFNNCEKVEDNLYRIYCVNLRDMSGITMDSVLGLYGYEWDYNGLGIGGVEG